MARNMLKNVMDKTILSLFIYLILFIIIRTIILIKRFTNPLFKIIIVIIKSMIHVGWVGLNSRVIFFVNKDITNRQRRKLKTMKN